MRRIGIMTGGGDAPGLNGIIEAVGRCLLEMGFEVWGVRNGFEGIFKKEAFLLERSKLIGLHAQAGTTLGTSNKTGTQGREEEFMRCYEELGLDGLVVAGGDGTFRGLIPFRDKVPIIGVPKTIDNDLSGTDFTFGYDTAVSVVTDAVDSLKHTAFAHQRIFVVETMGRDAGWIALGGGMAAYADVVLIPERPFDKEILKRFVLERRKIQPYLMVVVAEGAYPKGENPMVAFRVEGSPQAERYGGIAERLARWLEKETAWEARHVVLGHLQRSRAPTTTDRFFTMMMGVKVAQLINEKKWNRAVVYREGHVVDAPLEDVMGPARRVPENHPWLDSLIALGSYI